MAAQRIAAPLAAGHPARWQRYDWTVGAPAEWHEIRPADAVVLEGCGAGAGAPRPYTSTSIWVDAAPQVRVRRLRARADWPQYAPHVRRWTTQEAALRARDRTREHADVIVDNDEFGDFATGPAAGS